MLFEKKASMSDIGKGFLIFEQHHSPYKSFEVIKAGFRKQLTK
jgi:hypothetical protein